VLPRGGSQEAYQEYLRASLYAIHDEPEAMNHAIRLFKLSVAADRNYALGWAGLSRQLTASAEQELAAPRDVCAPARDAGQRALSLNENLVEGHLALAWYAMLCEWNWSGAEKEFRRAVDLDPSYLLSLHDYGRLLVIVGRFDEAVAAFNRALEADRGWNWLLNGLANAHLKAGRFDEATRYLDASCSLEALPGCVTRRGMVLAAQGRHQEAITHYRQSLEKQPYSTWTNGHYGYSLAQLGRRKEAEDLIASLSTSPLRQVPEFEIAAIHSGLGSREDALDWLERAYDRRSPTIMYAGVDFRFNALRTEPRFQDLLRKINLR